VQLATGHLASDRSSKNTKQTHTHAQTHMLQERSGSQEGERVGESEKQRKTAGGSKR
jgi:hypothetical protein